MPPKESKKRKRQNKKRIRKMRNLGLLPMVKRKTKREKKEERKQQLAASNQAATKQDQPSNDENVSGKGNANPAPALNAFDVGYHEDPYNHLTPCLGLPIKSLNTGFKIPKKQKSKGNETLINSNSGPSGNQVKPCDEWKMPNNPRTQRASINSANHSNGGSGTTPGVCEEHKVENTPKQNSSIEVPSDPLKGKILPISSRKLVESWLEGSGHKNCSLISSSRARLAFEASKATQHGYKKIEYPEPAEKPEANSLDDYELLSPIIDTEEVLGGIKVFREQNTNHSEKACGQLTKLSQRAEETATTEPKKEEIKKIYVVLDTNALIADLMTVDEIQKSRTGENGSCQVILLVPWVVLQELDNIKDDKHNLNSNLKVMANKAVRYLHDRLSSNHPQVKGQTPKESQEEMGISVECNDDRILQCCIQYRRKVQAKIILFTNDRNLCNKAIISCIDVHTKESIMLALDRLAPATLHKTVLEMKSDQTACPSNKTYESTVLHLRTTLREILALILRTEMYDFYGDIWMDVVFIKPPWRLIDVVQCFLKHWIAVFARRVQKNAKVQLDIIYQKLKVVQSSVNLESLKTLLASSLAFLSYFNTQFAYRASLKNAICSLRKLLDDFKKTRLSELGKAVIVQEKKLSEDQHSTPVNQPKSESDKDLIKAKVQDPIKTVLKVFHHIWDYINHTCGMIIDSLGLENPIIYSRPSVLPTASHAVHFMRKFFPLIYSLKNHAERVCNLPEDAPANSEEYHDLCYELDNFFILLDIDETKTTEEITTEMLHTYCNSNKKELLKRGCVQLQDFCTIIYQCILVIQDKDLI